MSVMPSVSSPTAQIALSTVSALFVPATSLPRPTETPVCSAPRLIASAVKATILALSATSDTALSMEFVSLAKSPTVYNAPHPMFAAPVWVTSFPQTVEASAVFV